MTPTDKPMTVEALMTLVNRYAEACDDLGADLFAQDATKHAALHEAASAVYAQIRAAIEQYGREQGFESTAQRDVREACYELRDALGNPVISGTGDQTIQGQTIRMAAARLRGSGEPVAFAYKSTQQPHDIHITSTARNNTARGLACGISFPVYTVPQPREPLTEEQERAAVAFATKMHVERRTNAHADICDDRGEVYATCSWGLDAGLRAEALRDLINEAVERAHNIRSEG